MYSVNLWGSHPEYCNDDCYTGRDYETLTEALEAYKNPEPIFGNLYNLQGLWIQLDGPETHEERQFPGVKPSLENDDEDWRREIANEAGMLGGCDAYNEVMGYY
jgi:hypothetical protein